MALDSKDTELQRAAAQNEELNTDLKKAREELRKLRAELTLSFQMTIEELKLKIK